MDIASIVQSQRNFFNSGKVRSLEFRLKALEKLRQAVLELKDEINGALFSDLNKHPSEVYICETGLVLDEIRFHKKHLRKWMKDQRVRTPLSQFKSRSFISPEPYGVVLIVAPWNYPIQLSLEPLIGAISGGNCAVIKPSSQAEKTSHIIARIIERAFPPEYITVAECNRDTAGPLLKQKWDYIFFTGSMERGRDVMVAAAKNLTPVTLELGGKSPVIVDNTSNLKVAARRIAFGKVLNAGQTCVAPDYLLIHKDVRDTFIEEYRNALNEFFPDGDMSDMVTIVGEKHYNRVESLLKNKHAVIGGGTEPARRFVEPTVFVDITTDSPLMSMEIFGPILPVITWSDINWCIDFINSRPKPLAFYLFTEDKAIKKKILNSCSFGGGCINDTIIHLATHHMGFGGVGASGFGQYHGKRSFDTFSHHRSIVDKATWLDLPMRYYPYTKAKLEMVKKFIR